MSLIKTLEQAVAKAVSSLYQVSVDSFEFQATRKEFAGDITLVVFPLLKTIKGNPVQIGEAIGNYLVEHVDEIKGFNVVKGFLNIELSDAYFLKRFQTIATTGNFGFETPQPQDKAVMVEYSSPNTNKPLHLGHIRNNLLGYSVAEIIKASGKKVYKTQIINDRGIHICKSMLAWKRFGNGETPESTGLKGDKLVGNYYVKFDNEFRKEIKDKLNQAISLTYRIVYEQADEFGVFNMASALKKADLTHRGAIHKIANLKMDWIEGQSEKIQFNENARNNYDILFAVDLDHLIKDKLYNDLLIELNDSFKLTIDNYFAGERVKSIEKLAKDYFTEDSSLIKEAQDMLRKWEAGDAETVALWETMNGWVYKGFDETYKNLGVNFDCLYYESDTYLLGKEFVDEGLKSGVFFKKEDGSVWCDLTEDGLDEKIVLRADGTAVYMTQDIGTAIQRIKDYPDVGGMVYTVGNEQDYHFKVLFLILKKLGFDWAKNLYHLSYGMVDLPSGKMKSREGTVVDADDLIVEMTQTAEEISKELGKLDDFTEAEKQDIYRIVGLGALKYYILKVDPKKRILFDPKESVDFQGNTGPFIQYTYARIQSILRKASASNVTLGAVEMPNELQDKEKELLKQVDAFPDVVQQAAQQHSPALVANYTYELVKEFNSFYQNVSILGAENPNDVVFRVELSKIVGETIKKAFSLLGIEMPERM